jgi:hypothetical protein
MDPMIIQMLVWYRLLNIYQPGLGRYESLSEFLGVIPY